MAEAVVLAAVSCQKSAESVQPAEEGKETIGICVNGLMGEYAQQDGVKSSLVNTVRVAWAAGDAVYVFDGTKYLGKLTAALDKKADGQTGWRTLSIKEWEYLFMTSGRMVNGEACYSNAVSGVSIESVTYKCVFVYPDNYNGDIVSSSMTWNDINAAGIVFLPAAGYRDDASFDNVDEYGNYWSSSVGEEFRVFDVTFNIWGVGVIHESERDMSYSLRLVTDVK